MPTLSRRQFLLGRGAPPTRPIARVAEGCLEVQGIVCRRCGDACEPRALSFLRIAAGFSRPVVDPDRCTGCGECAAACPAAAITLGTTA